MLDDSPHRTDFDGFLRVGPDLINVLYDCDHANAYENEAGALVRKDGTLVPYSGRDTTLRMLCPDCGTRWTP